MFQQGINIFIQNLSVELFRSENRCSVHSFCLFNSAFFIITLLAWVAVTVSGTTPEISSTTDDTVNIPCLFGEGTVRNIFWSYNDDNGRHKILFLADGNLHKEAEYANRASLQDDFSTLILKDITVADEGTYHCVVDRQGQTAVTNINTQLNVFSKFLF